MRWRTPRSVDDFTEEIRSHIDFETDRLIAEGITPAQAKRIARSRFGSLAVAKERFYESRAISRLIGVAADVRYAIRQFRASPAFTISVVVTLSVAFGANAVLFTV